MENIDPTTKNPSFYAFQFRINILLKSWPILFFMHFINFGPYFRRFISFTSEDLDLTPNFAHYFAK